MPRITKNMFLEGAITADYAEVEMLTKRVAEILIQGKHVVVKKDGYKFEMSIKGRMGIESTGRHLIKG